MEKLNVIKAAVTTIIEVVFTILGVFSKKIILRIKRSRSISSTSVLLILLELFILFLVFKFYIRYGIS